MELFSSTTRFCLACNVSTKIIEAIQSRAAILRYSRLSNEQVLQNLLKVCEAEKTAYVNDGLEALLFTSEGDMRHALNNLQACCSLGGIVNQATVFKICDQPHPKTVGEIIDFCKRCVRWYAFFGRNASSVVLTASLHCRFVGARQRKPSTG
jgi:replication factor C subunit 2/4